LQVHSKNKPLAKDVNLRKIAERTPGFSGADLANLVNEAAIFTARQNKKEVTAYHEGGHALIGSALTYSDPVHKVSIISRGRAAGYTMKLPFEDKHLHTKQSFLDEIAALLGGFAA